MTPARAFAKLVAALSLFLLASCLLLAGAAAAASSMEQVPGGEAVLEHNFRPIATFRATFLGAPPAARVRKMQERINALGRECAKPLFLQYLAGAGLKHDRPIIASEAGQPQALIEAGGYSITDEGFGSPDKP